MYAVQRVTAGIVVPLLLVVPAFGAQVSPAAALRNEVQQAVKNYVDAWNRGDAASVSEMYSRQPGVTSVGDGEVTRGWDRIREAMDQLLGMEGKFKITTASIDVVPLGPGYALALTNYLLTVRGGGQEVQQRGAMTLVFQKLEGEWKVLHDHTSTKAEGTEAPQAAVAPGGAAAQPVAAAAVTRVPIASGQVFEVPATTHVQYAFDLPPGTCTVSGRITGISGGNKDFEAFILDADSYQNWRAGAQANAYWQSGRVVVASIAAVLPGPGKFHLVISNAWSTVTDKTVQAEATAQCSP